MCYTTLQIEVRVFSKSFWNFIKQFLTNEGFKDNKDITHIHRNKMIADEKQFTQLFNDSISVVGKNQWYHVENLGVNFENTDVQSVRDTVRSYRIHLNMKIKKT